MHALKNLEICSVNINKNVLGIIYGNINHISRHWNGQSVYTNISRVLKMKSFMYFVFNISPYNS